jgi:hypothetical protein
MPRKPKQKPTQVNGPAQDSAAADLPQGESVAGYFRKVFQDNPKLLQERSNEELLRRWLADHPGHAEVPPSVKASLSNIKSVLRRKKQEHKARRAAPQAKPAAPPPAADTAEEGNPLEQLEGQIDEALVLARTLDRKSLEGVIDLLRRARNQVVWMLMK